MRPCGRRGQKKASDTVVLDVSEVLGITDSFVITSGATTGRSGRCGGGRGSDRVGDREKPLHVEGLDTLRWVLLDYGDVVVHVFHTDARDYHDLERLWADVPVGGWTPPEG